jgi:nucleoid DNA-binding protein
MKTKPISAIGFLIYLSKERNKTTMSNRSKFAEIISEILGVSKKEGDVVLQGVTLALKKQLTVEGEAVLPGFGRMKLETRAARRGHNPKTGEPIDIPSKQVVKFKTFPDGI